MKIEKINDNQIRCTLTKEDLANRQIKLSELAYGSENAKALFREMMQQAAYEFGFEADDIPLMIEAVPMSSDSIILLISKVEYTEELDTRFSKFSDPGSEDALADMPFDSASAVLPEGADDILDMFRKMKNEKNVSNENTDSKQTEFIPLNETIAKKNPENVPVNVLVKLSKIFVFHHLDDVTKLAHILNHFYNEQNTLYKDSATHKYYLLLTKGSHSPEEFNKVCNILAEYATQIRYTEAEEAYFEEHCPIILKDNALQILATL